MNKMSRGELVEKLERFPVITAVKNKKELAAALQTESEFVFVLFGDLCEIREIISKIKEKGKLAVVHMDLIDGLAQRETAVDFLVETARVDGIISTKPQLLRRGKSKGIITVQRFFLLDSMSLQKIFQQSDFHDVDLIEILPGCMPKIIRKVCSSVPVPVIAGGLIQEKDDVVQALSAGAAGVSSTDVNIWAM